MTGPLRGELRSRPPPLSVPVLVSLEPVVYRGELVALVGAERFHVVAPWLQDRPSDDADLRFVLFMCHYRCQVETGELPGPFTSERAAFWARCVLIDSEELMERSDLSDPELAEHFGVPVDQITAARLEGAT